MMERTPIIEIRGAKKRYTMGDVVVHALNGVDLTIRENDYVAIMGPSGSGKSTLMNIIGCLDRPTEGGYRLRSQPVENLDDDELSHARNREIGFIFQSFHLLPQMNVLQNVELPMVYAGMAAAERHRRATASIARVGLGDRAHHLPNELSGGQRQRVAIARALVNGPALLLADEPTGNLDSKTGREIMAVFEELHEAGNTIVLVTHDTDVSHHAERVIHLRDGVIEREEAVGDRTIARRPPAATA
ncbi:MAG: ABC transporter ATP-binding protein [Candidatus Sumerlaeia bacterium]|nr:ABC transporter ATP-binding protein [Candidatus Sumerlaeia bacterium]